MADALVLETQPRSGQGSRDARRLRKKGLVPAVIYGHKEETLSVAVPTAQIETALRHHLHVVDIKTPKGTEKAQIREIQWDHLGKDVLHVDFIRRSLDERITVPVSVEIRGHAPGIAAGGVLDQPLHTLSVECLAVQIPESIRVNVNELQLGGAIHVKDLVLPPDVKALADPDAIVVHVIAKATEPEPGAAEAGQVEPEVIGRKEKAEEEGEE